MTEDQFQKVFDFKMEVQLIQAQWFSSNAQYAIIIQSETDDILLKTAKMPTLDRLKVSVYDFERLPFTCFSQL